MDRLDELLQKTSNDDGTGRQLNPEREIYEEEQKKIDEWKGEVQDQVNNNLTNFINLINLIILIYIAG